VGNRRRPHTAITSAYRIEGGFIRLFSAGSASQVDLRTSIATDGRLRTCSA
jgi:hypothetical protein